jgi:hypothetical protein
MTSSLIAAPARGGAIMRGSLVRRRIDAFRETWRAPIAALCARHPWIADLAVSFPALLAQAAAIGGRAEPGLALAMAGAPLGEIARALGVAMWLRALPARAFNGAIPPLPDSIAFRRQIANAKPKSWRAGPVWLNQIAFAARWGGEDFALWVAKNAPLSLERRHRRVRRAVTYAHCLWAWHSQRADWAFADTIATPWRPEMKWAAARDAADAWLISIGQAVLAEPERVAEVWPPAGVIDGFTFTPIRTREGLNAESDAMAHCVKDYADDLASVTRSLWSVRADGNRVATLQLNREYCEGPFAAIGQMTGRANAEAGPAVWRAARKFALLLDDHAEALKPLVESGRVKCPKRWRAMWRDYWRAHPKAIGWLRLSPPEYLWASLNDAS